MPGSSPVPSIRVANVETGNNTQLTNEYRQASIPEDNIDTMFDGVMPVHTNPWSADSSTVYFNQKYGYGSQGGISDYHYDIFKVSVSGGEPVKLTETPGKIVITGETGSITVRVSEMFMSFSPDHSQVLFGYDLSRPVPPNEILLAEGLYTASLSLAGPSYARPLFDTWTGFAGELFYGWKTLVQPPSGCIVTIRSDPPVYGYETPLDALLDDTGNDIVNITGRSDVIVIERSIVNADVVRAKFDEANSIEFWFYSGGDIADIITIDECNALPVETVDSSELVAELQDDYGVLLRHETDYEWTEGEIHEIYAGVISTAASFALISSSQLPPPALFRTIVNEGDTLPYIVLYKGVVDTPELHHLAVTFTMPDPSDPTGTNTLTISFGDQEEEAVTNGGCRTFQGSGSAPQPPAAKPRMIVCNSLDLIVPGGGLILAGVEVLQSNPPFTQYVLVHEFGHIFNNRTRASDPNATDYLGKLYEAVDETHSNDCADSSGNPTGYCITDNSNGVVMGFVFDGWTRGSRGWGSGPANIFTDFQQHPEDYFLSRDNLEARLDETGADMFLNWIYRKLNNNPPSYQVVPGNWQGFVNKSWNPKETGCYVSAGCPDSDYSGDARFIWMNGKMAKIFQEMGW